ncbi:hypothetical protein J4476_03900 [Candidatus Woesearchaeota archaeon]|nr:hypothetical protein [Candidatus Woesearchaeota archaeon]HIH26350.1 hypothetical protein [Nanoarchaeota archaeon]
MRKRERLQVIYDILKAIGDKNGKIKPTHILYKSNLSHQMMEEYLKELISGKFIEETLYNNSKSFVLTQKGFDYLNKYQVINDFIDSFGLN